MSNKVDKLFKDKLEGDTLQPSAQAWEKVESHLAKKNKMVLWLRVAAAVALLGLLTFAALNWSPTEGAQQKFVKTPDNKELQNKEQENKEQENKEVPAPNEDLQSIPDQVANVPSKKTQKKASKKLELKTQPVQEPKQEIIDVIPQQESVNEQTVAVVAPPVVGQQKNSKGITLTYSLPSIRKAEAPQVAAVETKKSGFERVLEIAKEVKNSDNPLGELREAKDDIFAFEFRKDKKKRSDVGME